MKSPILLKKIILPLILIGVMPTLGSAGDKFGPRQAKADNAETVITVYEGYGRPGFIIQDTTGFSQGFGSKLYSDPAATIQVGVDSGTCISTYDTDRAVEFNANLYIPYGGFPNTVGIEQQECTFTSHIGKLTDPHHVSITTTGTFPFNGAGTSFAIIAIINGTGKYKRLNGKSGTMFSSLVSGTCSFLPGDDDPEDCLFKEVFHIK